MHCFKSLDDITCKWNDGRALVLYNSVNAFATETVSLVILIGEEPKNDWHNVRNVRKGLFGTNPNQDGETLHSKGLLFYFTADGRVDFRELVKDLASTFHMRIELRQIGVRDESKMLGGLGMCGQPFCCSRFLKNFQPVSIKMAKEQGLSLNPTKISGACGRLMCCLAYEQKSYEYLNSITPPVGSTVRTPDGEGTVTEVNVISGMLKVRSNVESLAPKYYKREECVYLRGGRRAPRKPDPASSGEEGKEE